MQNVPWVTHGTGICKFILHNTLKTDAALVITWDRFMQSSKFKVHMSSVIEDEYRNNKLLVRIWVNKSCHAVQNIGSDFRARGKIRHERIQGDGGSDMGTGEMINKGSVRRYDRVACTTDSSTKETLGACKSLGLSQSKSDHGLWVHPILWARSLFCQLDWLVVISVL